MTQRATERTAAGRRVRYALVGLGHIAQIAILPAFAQAEQNGALTALVCDDPEKLRKLPRRYNVRRVCSHDDADELFESGDIDTGYITLPNSMHREYTLRQRQRERRYEKSDPFAPELLYFSDCILQNCEPEPSGEKGIADIRVIEALNRSIETGKWVSPELPQRRRRPTLRQEIRRPGIQPPPLVGGVHSATM